MPLAGATMYYRTRAFGPDTWAVTDEAGQYSLCGIPPMPAMVYTICGNDATAFQQAVDVRADTVLDIDATAWHKCLGIW